MFIVFQVPIADSRSFIDAGDSRLHFPTWDVIGCRPTKAIGKEEYVHSFGRMQERFQKGVDGWAGELCYCKAEGAIRFEDSLGSHLFGAKEKGIRLECAFRRLFHYDPTTANYARTPVSRLEIGFTRANVSDKKFYQTELNSDDINQIISDILALDIHFPLFKISNTKQLKTEISCKLQDIGSFAAKRYLHSTISHNKESKLVKTEEWWVTHGSPMLIMELEEGECEDESNKFKYDVILPPEAKNISMRDFGDIKVWYLRKESIDIWFLLYPSSLWAKDSQKQKLREIRLHLSRINAEIECLKIIMYQIKCNLIKIQPITTGRDPLQYYLSKSSTRLSKQQYFGIKQGAIVNELQNQRYGFGELNDLRTTVDEFVNSPEFQEYKPNCKNNIRHLHSILTKGYSPRLSSSEK